jgi:hypothetical protein
MWQGKLALNTITCVVFDGYSTNISELYATQQDAIHKVWVGDVRASEAVSFRPQTFPPNATHMAFLNFAALVGNAQIILGWKWTSNGWRP